MKKNIKKNISIPRLSIYSIALSGIFLGLAAGAKLMDQFMPKAPIGASFWEIYWTVLAMAMIILPWAPAVLVLVASPFIFLALGQTFILTPFSFFLDYSLPIFVLIIIKFAANKYTATLLLIFSAILKFCSHTFSGVYFYDVSWSQSAILNWPYVLVTFLVTVTLVFLLFKPLRDIKARSITKGQRW